MTTKARMGVISAQLPQHGGGCNTGNSAGTRDEFKSHAGGDEQIMTHSQQLQLAQHRDDPGLALFCIPHTNLARHMCIVLTQSDPTYTAGRVFRNAILLCILLSTVALSAETRKIGKRSVLDDFLRASDFIVNIAFSLEFVIKVVARGFRRYISSRWNQMNFFIVVTSDLEMLLAIFLENQPALKNAAGVLRVFRIFRVLRPLRIAAEQFPGLMVLVKTAQLSAGPLGNTLVMILGFLCVFSIVGVQIFANKMNSCSDPDVWVKMECAGLAADGTMREWIPYDVNFDNIGIGVMSQLMLATQDDWPVHMFAASDVTGPVTGGSENQMIWLASTFYIASVLMAGAVLVNTVVGIFVENYDVASQLQNKKLEEIKKQQDAQQTPETLALVREKMAYDLLKAQDVQDRMLLYHHATGLRRQVVTLVNAKVFDLLIAAFILLNTICMAIDSWKPAAWQKSFDVTTDYFFAYVFGMEALVKIYAMRGSVYVHDIANAFDLAVVMVSYIGFAIDDAAIAFDPSTLRMLRIFRLLRILRTFRIFKTFKGLYAIGQTLIGALPAIRDLAVMLAVLFYIFSILGVNLFGSMCVEGDETATGLRGVLCLATAQDALLDRHAHFQGTGIALLTLFRVSTGDAWGELMVAAGLTAGARQPVQPETWDMYLHLQPDTPLYDASSTTQLSRDSKGAALAIAKVALRKWHDSVKGREEQEGWPFPGGRGEEWMVMARLALPKCITDSEAEALQAAGLVDCSIPGAFHSSGPRECEGTCGTPHAVAWLFFVMFCALSSFMILQLVIGVLMDIFASMQTSGTSPKFCPGSELETRLLARIQQRWLHKAQRKLASKGDGAANLLGDRKSEGSSTAIMSRSNKVAPL